MRINVYSQELTDEVLLIEKKSNTDITYRADIVLTVYQSQAKPGDERG
jgi:hypothetical protein